VTIILSNGSTLKLKDVKNVPKLKRNLIFVSQLANSGMKITFDGDLYKITKGVMITSHGKKEGALYMTSGSTASISVASLDVDVDTCQRQLGHMSEKKMNAMLSKGKSI